MPADVNDAFIVAFWLEDIALKNDEYIQPQKMHRLLFIAQAYYAVINEGRKLMPSVFVADELGPIEPNVYAAFSRGRPNIDVELDLVSDIEDYLLAVWKRFGHYSIEHLNKITKNSDAYITAFKRGPRGEISLKEMVASFAKPQEKEAPDVIKKPKRYRTQSGRSVHVKKWLPRKKT